MEIQIAKRFGGPPGIGHGGYVAGLFAERASGPVQVTLRRPAPLDSPLSLESREDGGWTLSAGETLVAEAEPTELELQVPPSPGPEAARAAEAGSPSFYNERGVHPPCFGCSCLREPGDGLRIFVGPCSMGEQEGVAGVWDARPFADGEGRVAPQWIAAALDCPGAFAFIAAGERAGLLGRISVRIDRPVTLDAAGELVVTGWRVGSEGRKLYAGTALFDAQGELHAVARATWFGPPRG
jgi:hypothetical protein